MPPFFQHNKSLDSEYKESQVEEAKKKDLQGTLSGTEKIKQPQDNKLSTEEEQQRKFIEEQKREDYLK